MPEVASEIGKGIFSSRESRFYKGYKKRSKQSGICRGLQLKSLLGEEGPREEYGKATRKLGFLRVRTLNRLKILREYREITSLRYARNYGLLRGFDLWCELAEQKDPFVVSRIVRQRNFRDMNVVLTCTAVIEYLDRVGKPVLLACCRHFYGDESRDILLAPDTPVSEWPTTCEWPEELFNMIRPD